MDRYTICSVEGMKGYKKFNAVVHDIALRSYKAVVSDADSSCSDREVDKNDLDLFKS